MIIKCQEHYNKVVEYAKVSVTIHYNNASSNGRTVIVRGVIDYGKPDESYAIKLNSFHG